MIVREGFRKMLELEDDLEVVGEAQNGRQAVAMVKKLRPAVIVSNNVLNASYPVVVVCPITDSTGKKSPVIPSQKMAEKVANV